MRLTRGVFKAIYYNTKCLLCCMSFVIFLYQAQKQLNLRDDKLPFYYEFITSESRKQF